jgi:hypothetical protein
MCVHANFSEDNFSILYWKIFMFPKLQFRGTHLYFSPRVQYVFHETFDSDERRNIVFVKEMIIIYFSNILNDFTVQGGACAHGSCQYKVNNYVFFLFHFITSVLFIW